MPKSMLKALIGSILIMATAISATATEVTSAKDGDKKLIRLGDQYLEIPSRYLINASEASWWERLLHTIPGLDDNEREVLVQIDARDVAMAVPKYKLHNGVYKEDIRARLVLISSVEKSRYLDSSQFSEIWSAKGGYKNRIVEKGTRAEMYRVYRRVEYPFSWEVFTISPDTKKIPKDIFSFWLGHCLRAQSSLTQSGSIVNCDSYAIDSEFALNFRVSGKNIHLVPEIRSYLVKLMKDWRVKN